MRKDLNLYGKIFKYLKQFSGEIIVLSLLTVVRIALTLPIPKTIDLLFMQLESRQLKQVAFWIGVVSALLLVTVVIEFISNLLIQKIGHSLTCAVRKELLQKILAQPYAMLLNLKTGDTIERISGDSMIFQEFVMGLVINPSIALVMLIVYSIVLFRLNVILTCIIVLSVILSVIVASAYHTKIVNASFKFRNGYGVLYNRLIELFSSLKLIKSMNYEDKHLHQFDVEFQTLRDDGKRMENIMSQSTFFNAFITTANLLLILIVGGYLIATKRFSVGQFISYYIFFQFVNLPIATLTAAIGGYQKSLSLIKRVFELMDMPSQIEHEEKQMITDTPFVYGDIQVKNVSFAYDNGNQIFTNFNCTFKKNAINVITGASGAGKTTLLDMLLKLYKPSTGEILVSSKNLNSISHAEYAKNIAVFTQNAIIFDDTVRNNISYFKEDASQDEIIAAAKKAHIHDYILTLPEQYKTITGESGNKLSGGESARIVLARIFLKQPSLIFMDEPTANIDGETEAIIYEALQELKSGSLIIVIAHTKTILPIADNVIAI